MKNLIAPLALLLTLNSAIGAEDEILLLSFDGDLIGPLANMQDAPVNAQQARRLVRTYHQLLVAEARDELDSLHQELVELIPKFEVAYTAADSAEIAHIMSEMDLRLAAIQEIHATQYTTDVVAQLIAAYQLILPTFGDAQ